MYMHKIFTLKILALSVFLSACGSDPDSYGQVEFVDLSGHIPSAKGMNVLVISFDAFRADIIGRGTGFTPHLDDLATRSLVFENAYSAGQSTASSFAAAFTGQYSHRSFNAWMVPDTQTMARLFNGAGYETAAFLANQQLVDERNYGQGFEHYEVVYSRHDEEPLLGFYSFLGSRDERPFFAWVHLINPHGPYLFRERFKEHFEASYDGPFRDEYGTKKQLASVDEAQLTAADINRIKQLYRGEVALADDNFRRIMNMLEERDLAADTLVLVTADHGESFMEHGRIGHGTMFEEVIRIPMMLHHPDMQVGQVISQRVSNIDLLPSLAGITGVEYIDTIVSGVDWSRPFDANRLLMTLQNPDEGWLKMAGIAGNYKLVINCLEDEASTEELYDLTNDPGERHDLLATAGHDDVSAQIFRQMSSVVGADPCAAMFLAREGGSMTDMLDDETIEALKTLGYIQ